MELLRNISDRERRAIIPIMVLFFFIAILLFVDLPIYKKGVDTAKKAKEERGRLNSMISMGREYLSVKYELDDIKERAFSGEGAALAGLDSLVNKSGLKKKLASLKPTATPVADGLKKIKAELTLEKATLAELSRLLTAMESDVHPITVERSAIKASYDSPNLFNATLVVNTVEKD